MNIFLETDRLILRNLTQDDVDDLVRLDSDPEVMRFINGGIATTRERSLMSFYPTQQAIIINLQIWVFGQ